MNSKTKKLITDSGDWLYNELIEAGANDTLAKNICFAMGQRQAMLDPGGDLMEVAREVLARYKRGDIDIPGPALADGLLREKFGDPIDRTALLRWLLRTDRHAR